MIAGVALVVLIGAILFSKRGGATLAAAEVEEHVAAAAEAAKSVTARHVDAGVAGAAPAFARLCLRHSRNGGISDSTMIRTTIGKR